MTVRTTGELLSSSGWDPRALFRKNTIASVDWVEIVPDATLTSLGDNAENPELGSSDQLTGELCVTEDALEPTESTQPCVALTLSERPCVDELTLPTLMDGLAEASCTFTRGGTVTITVWVRLLEEPCCASATREIIALAIATASIARRSETIYRASSHRENQLSGNVFWVRHNMYLPL